MQRKAEAEATSEPKEKPHDKERKDAAEDAIEEEGVVLHANIESGDGRTCGGVDGTNDACQRTVWGGGGASI